MCSLHVGRAFCLENNFQYIVPVDCVTEKNSGLLLAIIGTLFLEILCFNCVLSLTDPCTRECLVLFPCVCYFSQQA